MPESLIAVVDKHHGLGNDFLVLDLARNPELVDPGRFAVAWCDRRRGVGADGLLVLGWVGSPDQTTEISMVLFNADGSRAEMSGNGIRCLVQAAFRSQRRTTGATYVVHTDAGRREVAVEPTSASEIHALVGMGQPQHLEQPEGWSELGVHPDRPVSHLGLGNPHAVVGVDDVTVVDLEALGARVPDVNLEIVEPGPEPDAITMRVHERGVGLTQACGTGASAAAVAAVSWGLVVQDESGVIVHMPGGDVRVRVPRDGAEVVLGGPATHIAEIRLAIEASS